MLPLLGLLVLLFSVHFVSTKCCPCWGFWFCCFPYILCPQNAALVGAFGSVVFRTFCVHKMLPLLGLLVLLFSVHFVSTQCCPCWGFWFCCFPYILCPHNAALVGAFGSVVFRTFCVHTMLPLLGLLVL